MSTKTIKPPEEGEEKITIVLFPSELARLNDPPPDTCRHSIDGHKMTVRQSQATHPGRYFVICAGCYEKFWIKDILGTVYKCS